MDTTQLQLPATQPNHPHSALKRRGAFAREAAIDAFGPGAARTLDEPHFADRQPDQSPRLLGRLVAKMVCRIASKHHTTRNGQC